MQNLRKPITNLSLEKHILVRWARLALFLTAVILLLSLAAPTAAFSFVVNTTDDFNDESCDVEHCSLREAIIAANSSEGLDTITFSIPGTFWASIQPETPLPAITDPIEINGYLGTTYAELNGSAMQTASNGLVLDSGGNSIIGITIRDFDGHGILIPGNDGNWLENNSIYYNSGDGIRIAGGSGHTLTWNAILDNGGLGINLGGDGVTANDPGDGDIGANDLINYPVVIRTTIDEFYFDTTVEGIYNGLPNADYTLEFFSNAQCDPSGFGEGDYFLGSINITTDDNGNASFNEIFYGGEGEFQGEFGGEFITATATDSFGNTSEFSQCGESGPGNDSWPRALELDLIPDEISPEVMTAVHSQFIDKQDQSRWFKFPVQPNSQLVLTLTDLPENYDITVYKDVAAAYNDLLNPADNNDLLELSAEFAPDAFSPDAFSPDAFSPDAFSPDAFSPDAFSPDAFSPDAFSPDAFSSAQMRSLLGVSAFNGTASEGILLNTWENDGFFYVRVRGRNGVFSAEAPFYLEVTMTTGVCNGVSANLPQSTHTPIADSYDTIILVDSTRMPGSPTELADMQTSLNTLAARPDVNGVVVNVNSDARVAAANAQADAFPTCPYAKNLVAHSVKEIIDGYRELNPLQYIVIVGNDDVIPFFRHPDQAMLANERNYTPPVRDNTASQASLKLGYVLSQDRYGAGREISSRSDSLPIPELAVGRLVETPAEVIGMVNAYLATANGVIDTPDSALVTGYDFLEDAALAVTAELEAGLGAVADTLIVSRDLSPQDPLAWTADDMRNALLTERHDIAFLAGHFSAGSALAADYTTRMLASEVAASSVDMTNAIIFSAGCHSGYNIVTEHGIPGISPEPDWAQAFAQKQATLIAGTGYQYGDTDFIEYSERIYLEFSNQLRLGTGPVSIGDAFVAAKQVYLAETPQLRPLHEKAFLEATIFGLPMLRVDMPAGRGTATADESIVPNTSGFNVNPGLTLGLEFADVRIDTTVMTETVELKVIGGEEGETITATYLTGADGVVTNPAEPVLPLELPNVSVEGMVLRGVGFRGGAFSDTNGILPLTGAATTEVRGVHPPFLASFFYPAQFWRVNYYDALANEEGLTRLALTPAQYRSSGPASITGTMRQFSRVDFRLYYSDYTEESAVSGNKPALAAPPAISDVTAVADNGNLIISARVVGDPSAGIQEVWVTYTAPNGPFAGQWQSLDLTQNTDTTRWSGVLPLNGTPPEDVQFIIQAVNGVGVVGSLTNLGAGFTSVPETFVDPELTTLSLLTPPTSGDYGSSATVSAQLMGDAGPLADQFVTFGIGGQQRAAVTDNNGVATATLALLGLPGDTEIKANFGGTAVYLPSSDTAPFTINQQAAVLTIDPADQTVFDGQTAVYTTTLADAEGRPLGQKTVVFIITDGAGDTQAVADITDYAGRVFLNLTLPPETYTIDAYFGGVIPLPEGDINLDDDRYLAATAAATLTVLAEGNNNDILYLSSNSRGFVDNQFYADEDILAYDMTNQTWSLHFDGSDVGLRPTDLDAMHIMEDDSILMSFNFPTILPGLGPVDDSDIVRFIPTSLGDETAGTWEWFFDGSDVGLSRGGEDVDAIGFTPDGRLVVSSLATMHVPQTGGGTLQAGDEQLIVLNNASFGQNTSGDWEMYFDGRDVGMRPEDVWGNWIDPLNGDIYLSLQNKFDLDGVSGNELDIFICHPLSLGDDSDCAFGPGLFFDGAAAGFDGDRIDAFAIRR